jgi:hypothetical protein
VNLTVNVTEVHRGDAPNSAHGCDSRGRQAGMHSLVKEQVQEDGACGDKGARGHWKLFEQAQEATRSAWESNP